MRSNLARRAVTFALVLAILPLPGSACIAFINDDATGLGGTCHIKGESTTCGSCITTICQPALDACCRDAACRDALGTVDTCAADFTNAACSSLQPTSSAAPTNPTDALHACLWSSCVDVCRTSTGAFLTSCSSGGGRCDCTLDAPPNATDCSAASLGNAFCCADKAWPASGRSCTCQAFACEMTGAGCRCGTDVTGPSTSCTGTYCCVPNIVGECSCSATPCDSSSVRVPSCSADTLTCENTGQIHVSSCAIKAGAADASVEGAAPALKPTCSVAMDMESCACSLGADGGSGTCNTSALGAQASLCCADPAWSSGSTGGMCRCDRVRCQGSSDNCSCEVNPQIPDDATGCQAAVGNCCLEDTGNACYCAQGPCQSGFSGATGCDPSNLACPTGEVRVPSCGG